MPKRNPMARALRTTLFRTRRTKTKAEKISQLERKLRGRVLVIDKLTNCAPGHRMVGSASAKAKIALIFCSKATWGASLRAAFF